MTPNGSPWRMSGAHMTEHNLRFTTEDEDDHCASCSASATTTGLRVAATRWTIESETRETAFSMVSRATLRAAFTSIRPSSSRMRKPLSACVTSSSASMSSSRSRGSSPAARRRSEKRTRPCMASTRAAVASAGSGMAGAAARSLRVKVSSLPPSRMRSPSARRAATLRRPFTCISAPPWQAALKSRPSKWMWSAVSGRPSSGSATSFSAPRPTVVMRRDRLMARSWPSAVRTSRVAIRSSRRA